MTPDQIRESVAHTIALQRGASDLTQRLLVEIRRRDLALIDMLIEANPQTRAESRRLIRRMQRSARSAYSEVEALLQKELDAFMEDEFDYVLDEMKESSGEAVKRPPKPLREADEGLGGSFIEGVLTVALSEFLRRWFESHHLHVPNQVASGLIQNEPVSVLTNRLKRQFRRLDSSVGRVRSRQLRTVITTVIHGLSNYITRLVARYNLGVFPQYLFLAVLDGRTSIICLSLHGKVFKSGAGPLPPQHPNCRSRVRFLTRDQDPPDIPDGTSWLKDQSLAYVSGISGMSRDKARLLLEGDLNIKAFWDEVNKRPKALSQVLSGYPHMRSILEV